MNFEVPSSFLDELADAAATAIMPHFRRLSSVENKAGTGFDPVTDADRDAESAMRALIADRFPTHGVIGEEYPSHQADADQVWILDPIDGTRAFITGLPLWGTLIGLTHGGVPSLGMMAQPFTGERFAGDSGRAWYTGPGGDADLSTRSVSSLSDAVLFTTTPALFSLDERAAYDNIEGRVRLVRYGCDCYAYCMVAAGHADLVIESGLNSFDIAGLIPVVEGAGGQVTDWRGNSAAGGGRILATGDQRVHDEALEILSRVP